jgi:uncharacterized protein YggE
MSVLAESGLPNQPYIHVVGTAEVKKPADTALFKFQVGKKEPDQVKAKAATQAMAAKVFAILKDFKIASNDIVAEDIKAAPEIERRESDPNYNKIAGYVVTREFEVKIRDVSIISNFVDRLLSIEGSQVNEVTSSYSKEKEVEQQLWMDALKNARERAEGTLKAMNMKIYAVFAVSNDGFTSIPSDMLGGNERVVVTGMNISTAPIQDFRLKPVKLSESLHVIYLTSPAN